MPDFVFNYGYGTCHTYSEPYDSSSTGSPKNVQTEHPMAKCPCDAAQAPIPVTDTREILGDHLKFRAEHAFMGLGLTTHLLCHEVCIYKLVNPLKSVDFLGPPIITCCSNRLQ